MALCSDGAALAHFLAARADDHSEAFAPLVSALVEAALKVRPRVDQTHLLSPYSPNITPRRLFKVLASARSYETIEGDAHTAALGDRGAVRAGELASRCCGVLATVARRAPRAACYEGGYGLAVRSAATLFALLASKTTASHLRTAASEALHALALALATCRADDVSKGGAAEVASLLPLRRLLWAVSKSSDFRARHCVVAWADGAAWGRGDPAATYLLSCLGSDPHTDVRQAAARALQSTGSSSEMETSDDTPIPALTGRSSVDAFVQFVAFAVAGGDGSPALKALPPRARASVVAFAADALRQLQGQIHGTLPTTRVSSPLPRLFDVVVASSAAGPACDASGAVASALATASLGTGDAGSSSNNASFLTAFAALVDAADALLDEPVHAAEGGSDEAAPSVVAASCLFLCLTACARALEASDDDGPRVLWRGLPGTLLRRFAAQTPRFAALAGLAFDTQPPAHAALAAATVGGSSSGGRAAADATAAALAVSCSELLGMLAPFAPPVAALHLLDAAAAILESEATAAGAASARVAGRHGTALGARRAAAVASLATVGALAAALHATTAPLEWARPLVAAEAGGATAGSGEAATGEGLARAMRRAVAAAGALVGCADTQVHVAAARAVTQAANFNVPLPSAPDEAADSTDAPPAPAPLEGRAPPSVQYASVEAAAAAGDRAAVRLLSARAGAFECPLLPVACLCRVAGACAHAAARRRRAFCGLVFVVFLACRWRWLWRWLAGRRVAPLRCDGQHPRRRRAARSRCRCRPSHRGGVPLRGGEERGGGSSGGNCQPQRPRPGLCGRIRARGPRPRPVRSGRRCGAGRRAPRPFAGLVARRASQRRHLAPRRPRRRSPHARCRRG